MGAPYDAQRLDAPVYLVSALAAERPRAGRVYLRYSLTAAARARIGVERLTRVSSRSCPLRTGCMAYRRIGAFTTAAHKGSNRTLINRKGRVRRLTAGRYRVRARFMRSGRRAEARTIGLRLRGAQAAR
jgi:hypothetical protein